MTKEIDEERAQPAERSIRARPVDLELFRGWFPDMPDYVLIDFIYKNYARRPERARELIPYYSRRRFSFGDVLVTPALFTPRTRERLRARAEGAVTGFRDDARKHVAQRKRLQQSGPPTEPLILRARPDGMELIEGWHRTIQGLQLWPDGYRQPAWIELPKHGEEGG